MTHPANSFDEQRSDGESPDRSSGSFFSSSSSSSSSSSDSQSSESAPVDFSVLTGFDVHSVAVTAEKVDLYVAVRAGRNPLDYPLGECCGNRLCRYPSVEVVGFSRKDDLVEAVIRDRMSRWPDLPPGALLEDLRSEVYRIRSHVEIKFASLRRHPFMYRVPVSLTRLRSTGKRGTAHASPEWEVVRMIKDVYDVAGIDLPFRRWEAGRDLALHRDHEDVLEVTNEGSFSDFVPLADERGRAFWLKLFQRLLGGPND